MNENHGEKTFQGLGGWLILVGIGVIISPFLNIYYMLGTFFRHIDPQNLLSISDPNSRYYSPLGPEFIYFDITLSAILSIFGFYLIYLFFRKNKKFPKYFIIISSIAIFLNISTPFMIYFIPIEMYYSINPSTVGQALLHSIPHIIWILYMNASVRVKQTFIE